MEFFLPSVLLLLISAAVIFFVLPQFGPSFLAIVSAVLLVFGIWKHYSTFGTEYRLATWHLGLIAYAPYIMIAGLLLVIGIYLLYLLPASTANNSSASILPSLPSIPTVTNMPSSNSATNSITAGINKAISSVTNAAKNNSTANSVLNALTGKKNNKGLFA